MKAARADADRRGLPPEEAAKAEKAASAAARVVVHCTHGCARASRQSAVAAMAGGGSPPARLPFQAQPDRLRGRHRALPARAAHSARGGARRIQRAAAARPLERAVRARAARHVRRRHPAPPAAALLGARGAEMSAAGRETKGAAPRELCHVCAVIRVSSWHSAVSRPLSPSRCSLSLASRADGVPRRREGFLKKDVQRFKTSQTRVMNAAPPPCPPAPEPPQR